MVESTRHEEAAGATNPLAEQRRLCLEHAADLVASAERVLASDGGYPNIAYHLAILALEEIGKAGMLSARAAARGASNAKWAEKRMDDHAQKLMWAVWSPSLAGGKIDPKDFETARRFAEGTHQRRMAGLYVDYNENSNLAAPRSAVSLEDATSLLALAKSRLILEEAAGTPSIDERSEELTWFLTTLGSDMERGRLFSQIFVKKYEEYKGDTLAWVRWARDEFAKIAEEEKEYLRRELSRPANERGKSKPKWLVKVRARFASHLLQQKILNYWNSRVKAVQLRTVGKKNEDLMIEMTLGDHVSAEQLFEAGLMHSKIVLMMLSIGSGGYFWYEVSNQTETYYESVSDLEAPHMRVALNQGAGLRRQWSEQRRDGSWGLRYALEDGHLENAIEAHDVFGRMSAKEAEPIFGPYLQGLMLLSKSDLHMSTEGQARHAFLLALRRAMHHFGDLPSETADLTPALHAAMQPMIPEEAHRTELFRNLSEATGAQSMADAISAKRVADLYLALVARRLWRSPGTSQVENATGGGTSVG